MRQATNHSSHCARRALVLSAIAVASLSVFPLYAPAAQAPSANAGSSATPAATATTPSNPTGRQVRATILRSIDGLRNLQAPTGRWPDYAQDGGVTALVTYALLTAGVAHDRAMESALQALRRTPNDYTYVVALKAMALAAADPKKYRDDIQNCADRLVVFQAATGGWSYGQSGPPPPNTNYDTGRLSRKDEAARQRVCERSDASNTQFALLGLSDAERAGARVPPDAWKKADRFLRATQNPDGGWGYVFAEQGKAPAKGKDKEPARESEPAESYGSMTAASLAGLALCNDRAARTDTPAAAAERQAAIDKGLAWISKNYTLSENPGRALAWYYFWLYGVERAGVATGRRMLGDTDWFREGTAMLVESQRADGSWTNRIYHDALCLLFLAKGYRPLLVERLEWDGPWRRDPRDLDHLTRYLEKRVGGEFVAWQTLRGDAPLEDWLAAPIVHVAGRGTLKLSAPAAANLKAYIEQGGLALFDAEGGDAAFADSVRKALAAMFPESKFEPLAADHPIFTAVHKLAPGAAEEVVGPATKGLAIAAAARNPDVAAGARATQLEVLNVGCRAAVLLAPLGLADGWAAADPAKPNDALRLGENLAVYATAGEALPERLAAATPFALPPQTPTPRGASRIGQIQHGGDWQPRPYALPNLLVEVGKRFGVAVANRPEPVRLTQAGLANYNVLYITGHYAFTLPDAERAALKEYLDRGGFLWAEACCGRPAFDKSLRELVKSLYPDTELEMLPVDHPIFQGKVGTPIREVAYSPAVKAEAPALHQPVLYGLTRSGHLVIAYSPYGLACGLDGMKTYGARTYSPADAKRLATNILLFGLAF